MPPATIKRAMWYSVLFGLAMEFQINVLLQSSPTAMIGVILLYSFLGAITHKTFPFIVRKFSSPKRGFWFSLTLHGILGVILIEWMIMGNTFEHVAPNAHPLFIILAQLGMFAWWATIAAMPYLLQHEAGAPLRKKIFWYYGTYAIVSTLLAVQFGIAPVILLEPPVYLGFFYFFYRKFASALLVDSGSSEPITTSPVSFSPARSMVKKILKYALIGFVIFIVLAIISGDKKDVGNDSPEVEKKEPAKSSATDVPNSVTSKTPQINIPGWSDSPFITRDGKELYYMYSRYNFFPTFSGGKPILEGTSVSGHNNNDANPYDDSDIYVSKRNSDGTWGKPLNLSFNDTRGGCCAMVVEGPPLTIYYQTYYQGMGTDLVYRVRQNNGSWGKEMNLGPKVNSSANEDNPHVSPNQDGIWFTSVRAGGKGGSDIWFSQKINGEWTEAINVGEPVNTEKNEDQIWISPVGNTIYFNRDATVYKTTWENGAFSQPTVVDLGLPFVAEVSLPDSDNEIFFAAADTSVGRLKIYSSKLQSDGSWGAPIPVD